MDDGTESHNIAHHLLKNVGVDLSCLTTLSLAPQLPPCGFGDQNFPRKRVVQNPLQGHIELFSGLHFAGADHDVSQVMLRDSCSKKGNVGQNSDSPVEKLALRERRGVFSKTRLPEIALVGLFAGLINTVGKMEPLSN